MPDNTKDNVIIVNRKMLHATPFKDEVVNLFWKKNQPIMRLADRKAVYDFRDFMRMMEEKYGLKVEILDISKAFSWDKKRINKNYRFMFTDVFTVIATFPYITNYEIQKCLLATQVKRLHSVWGSLKKWMWHIEDYTMFDEFVYLALETLMDAEYIMIHRKHKQNYRNARFTCTRDFRIDIETYRRLRISKIPTEEQHLKNIEEIFGNIETKKKIKAWLRAKTKHYQASGDRQDEL